MFCPYCNEMTKVLDSRLNGKGRVRRRRQCQVCGKRFSTLELVAGESPEAYEFRRLKAAREILGTAIGQLNKLMGGWK